MRIPAKGRYALAAMISMAQYYDSGQHITLVSISDALGISKIYLEQVFSLLKRAGLVSAVKGAQGGYQLTRMPGQITAHEILSAVELSLFEATQATVESKAPEIDAAMQASVFDPLANAVKVTLKNTSLADLVSEAETRKRDNANMFYI